MVEQKETLSLVLLIFSVLRKNSTNATDTRICAFNGEQRCEGKS